MKTLLITGTGSLAKRIMYRFKDKYDRIITVSRGETTHLDLPPWVIGEIGDVRDYERLDYLFKTYKPNVCIHTAAFKVLGLMQRYVTECIKTNVLGTDNIARACQYYDVKQSLLIGTDKSCNPVHNQIYGLSKSVARATYVDYSARPSNTNFLITLYGNISKSKNSMLLKWEKLINNDEEIVVYHKDLTRFMFSLDDSVDLIEKTLSYNINGATTIPIMNSYRVLDIAEALGVVLGKKPRIKVLNKLLPGEKMHEEMTSVHEQHLIYWLDQKTLCVLPSFDINYDYSKIKKNPYEGPMLSSDKFIDTNIDNIVKLINRSYTD